VETQDTRPATADFGFARVAQDEKAPLVADVFRSVARRYDLMNDLMSMGGHRLWKDFLISRSAVRPGQQVLDVAAGTGDLTRRFADEVGERGRVVAIDINPEMLGLGRTRLVDGGVVGNVDYLIGDAENLPLRDRQFDCVCIAFGLRNVTRITSALESMASMLRPGGRLLVLEFSRPQADFLARCYDFYSFNVIPRLGKIVAGDEASYRYLVESIRRHPDPQTLKDMMQASGLDDVGYHNLSGGIVVLHCGFRY
jgi:demethylmenaquinone methyltransferase/2-methoxy-6-polyprenyl-1,4-benzoquinol methylase|tara:strand:+ start:1166 stop:1927 length:762 start_codon:yes stop_codon:yes gene_type:complete